jgi:outer membrane immunogenic protein
MKNFVSVNVALLALCLGSGAASAADMAVKAPPAPPPVSGWAGFYVGGEAGYLWNHEVASTLFTTALSTAGSQTPGDVTGAVGGVDAGYNWQVGATWLFGVQADWLWTGARGSGTRPSNVAGITLGGSTKDQWIADVVARLGYETAGWLLYVRGGPAWMRSSYTANATTAAGVVLENASTTATKAGFDVGVGAERKIVGNLSGKVEYNYLNFATKQILFTFPGIGSNGANVRAYAHEFLVGFNLLLHP